MEDLPKHLLTPLRRNIQQEEISQKNRRPARSRTAIPIRQKKQPSARLGLFIPTYLPIAPERFRKDEEISTYTENSVI